MICARCKKDRNESSFDLTGRGNMSTRCRKCVDHVRLPTTCKRCLKTFPETEFRIGRQGKVITYCARCAEIVISARRKLHARMREKNKATIAAGEKACLRCSGTKILDDFKDRRGYVRRNCNPCREYMAAHQDGQRKEWTPEKRAAKRDQMLAIQRGVRDEVIAAYGGHCACCGESTREFLSIDHMEGNGAEHRRELKRLANAGEQPAATFYRWLRNNGYPKGFQVLCHNCNQAKGIFGTCPHRKNPLLLVETVGLGPMVVKSSGAPKKLAS